MNPIMIDKQLDEEKIIQEIIGFIQKEVSTSGTKGVVIGLSGGIDSSTTVAICERALGCDNVFILLMPEKTSNPKDLEHGQLIANQLNIP